MTREATSSGDASVRCFDFMYPCNLFAIMSAQPPYALMIPEILCEVLDHLESDPKTLFAACLVSKAWTEPSLNLLYRDNH
jgi:hypothetical protein